MRRKESKLPEILETYLPSVLEGDTTHKTPLIKAISTLQSPDEKAQLLAHLKESHSLSSCDPEVLLVLFQWVKQLMERPGLTIPTEIKQSNWQWALEALKIAAEEKQYPQALFISSSTYLAGIPNVLDADRPKCLAQLKKAADLGYPKAQHDYAANCMAGAGELLAKNLDTALEYYLLAANQDFAPSQAALGMIHLKSNRKEGLEWLTKAAYNKDPLAAYELAKLYSADNQKETALQYLKMAADFGHPQAQYDYSQSIKNNPVEYLRYLSASASRKHLQAKVEIQTINPEISCKAFVTLNKKVTQQEQRIQELEKQLQSFHLLIQEITKSQGNRNTLSENRATIMRTPLGPAADDSDTDNNFQDALTGFEKA